MPVFRIKKRSIPFVQIDRTTIEDARLSWKARGILAYLLSRPDNFVFHLDELVSHSTDGIDSLRSGIKELQEFGYVKRYPIKENGKIVSWGMEVYELPHGDFPHMEKPEMENPTLIINDLNKKDSNNKEHNTSFSPKTMETGYYLSYNSHLSDYIHETISFYYKTYSDRVGKDHPKLKVEQLERIYETLEAFMYENDLTDQHMVDVIEEFFATVKNTDYNLNHFATDGMLEILKERYYIR